VTPNARRHHEHAPAILRIQILAEKYADLPVPMPALTEQAAIARAKREIKLLDEYRTRLITDGVLDVREAAENLPKESDDPNLFRKNEDLLSYFDKEIGGVVSSLEERTRTGDKLL